MKTPSQPRRVAVKVSSTSNNSQPTGGVRPISNQTRIKANAGMGALNSGAMPAPTVPPKTIGSYKRTVVGKFGDGSLMQQDGPTTLHSGGPKSGGGSKVGFPGNGVD